MSIFDQRFEYQISTEALEKIKKDMWIDINDRLYSKFDKLADIMYVRYPYYPDLCYDTIIRCRIMNTDLEWCMEMECVHWLYNDHLVHPLYFSLPCTEFFVDKIKYFGCPKALTRDLLYAVMKV